MENVEDPNHVTSRLFGAEVHCGHIRETFLYYVDNLASGGANVVVEIMRQGEFDVSKTMFYYNSEYCQQ